MSPKTFCGPNAYLTESYSYGKSVIVKSIDSEYYITIVKS